MTIDDDRLKGAVEFNRSVKLSEARARLCDAAVEWYRAEETVTSVLPAKRLAATWEAIHRLHAAAKAVAELEET